MTTYKLFLDDLRTVDMVYKNWSDEEFIVQPGGYHAAKWLVYESGLDLSKLKFYVHAANPVASKQIQGLLDNYIRHLQDKSNDA